MTARDIKALLAEAAEILRTAGVESPRREARLVMGHALGVATLDIVSGRLPALTAGAQAHFEAEIARRAAREPLAYIVGSREFWSLDFAVGPGVLVPRPESEILVEEALRRFPSRELPLRVLDLGTGSGCLLLAFLSERPGAEGSGVDISADALGVAQRNAESLDLAKRAQFLLGDWTENLSGRFDAIFVNPPYIAQSELTDLPPEVARYEPRGALDGGLDGLEAYRQVTAGLLRCLNPSGTVFFEIGQGQAGAVTSILAEKGFAVGATVCDLAGIPRCLVAVARAEENTPKKQLALETRSG